MYDTNLKSILAKMYCKYFTIAILSQVSNYLKKSNNMLVKLHINTQMINIVSLK